MDRVWGEMVHLWGELGRRWSISPHWYYKNENFDGFKTLPNEWYFILPRVGERHFIVSYLSIDR